jgi:hypothetical protein
MHVALAEKHATVGPVCNRSTIRFGAARGLRPVAAAVRRRQLPTPTGEPWPAALAALPRRRGMARPHGRGYGCDDDDAARRSARATVRAAPRIGRFN